ncbi:hypothetical protein, partial [Streptomyces sp. NPDC001508]|uniref:hypothetical protein n=1 Tax=Streptomyces sp. NPDC001508 TaxID=3154656 RepID=UPI0033232427
RKSTQLTMINGGRTRLRTGPTSKITIYSWSTKGERRPAWNYFRPHPYQVDHASLMVSVNLPRLPVGRGSSAQSGVVRACWCQALVSGIGVSSQRRS